MRSIIQFISAKPFLARAFELGRLVAITGLSQILVQLVGFLCAILVIRMLAPTEYALYILMNTMLGTMAVLADGGISSGVTSEGGKVWRDREKLGVVLATGLNLRKKFGLISLIVAIPALLFLLRTHETQWLTSLLIVLAVIVSFYSTLTGSMLQIAPKLQQDIAPLQKNMVQANVLRLLMLGASLVFFPFAFIAVLASGLPQLWANRRLRAISLPYANWKQDSDHIVRRQIMTFVKRLLPGSIYYCISGQITIWLISIFGSTTALAQVGALTRLTMVLSLFNIMVNMLIIPRFARLTDNKSILLAWYMRIHFYLIAFCAMVVFAAWIFPEEVLWILGDHYKGLNYELLLSIIGSCLNLIVGINFALNASRGWLLNPVITICLGIAGITGGVLLLDISTLRGVLLFNIFTGVVGLFVHPLFGFLKIITKRAVYD